MSRTFNPAALAEYHQYIAPDGLVYQLHAPPSRVVLSVKGEGAPDEQYITQTGPFQHGSSVKDMFLLPRTIEFQIRHRGNSLEDQYYKIQDFLTAIRPNRTVGTGKPQPGTLRHFLPNGSWLDLNVYIYVGPKLTKAVGQWDQWNFTETIQFVAENPIYFDSKNPKTFTVSGTVGQIVGPIIGPIFGSSIDVVQSLVYAGEWEEYPTIIVTGPMTGPTVLNLTTGDKIALTSGGAGGYYLPPGRTITISLAYGAKTITLDDGTNLLPYLSADSTLTTFRLIPNPVSPGGLNTIHFIGQGTTAGATWTMNYNNRYSNLRMV